MNYQIGDQVVHWTYGPAKIVGMDEKKLAGKTRLYYVVQAEQATIWVPVDSSHDASLRVPSSHREFQKLLSILNTPGEELPDHLYQRQNELMLRMQKRSLNDVCYIIRDLVSRSQNQKLNRNDIEILKRAKDFLLDEWHLSLGTPRESAERELERLLGNDELENKPVSA
jgi:RNA polymerase-interacting CarD/CdnL/TRCF family regulator